MSGANIEGKHRGPTVYFGGADKYFRLCEEIAREGYKGLELRTRPPGGGGRPSAPSPRQVSITDFRQQGY
jgi:hypothetical protein